MRRLLIEIDFHIIVLGVIVFLLFAGVVSTVTFVPGTPRIVSVIAYCLLPFFVLLEPTIITRTIDRRNHRSEAVRYFSINTLVVLAFGIAFGLIVFDLLSK